MTETKTEAPDPLALTRELIRCPSVTPEEGGALALLERVLAPFGFDCRRVDRGGVSNLYARRGTAGPVFGFNGHTDVVPVGDRAAWTADPFGAELRDGQVFGRGATDMKSGVACFVSAICRLAASGALDQGALDKGSVALLITGDEEGDALDGTRALLDWMAEQGERLDVCLVGEPTSRQRLGDTIKIGRRGSLNAEIRAEGVQGHTAYPDRALNPIPPMARLLDRVASARLDEGTAHFEPSTLALTTVDVGNPATNVIPSEVLARLNIRFNDAQSSEALIAWLACECQRAETESGVRFKLKTKVSGEAFLTPPGPLSELVAAAVEAETGLRPELNTGGGTSDARFVKDHCPVVEFGLTGRTMHQVDECAPVEEIEALARIYERVLRGYFAG